MSATVDHITPLADGGAPLDRANVGLSHYGCNARAVTWERTGGKLAEDYATALLTTRRTTRRRSYPAEICDALDALIGRVGQPEVLRLLAAL
jgi:hypothetical protein